MREDDFSRDAQSTWSAAEVRVSVFRCPHSATNPYHTNTTFLHYARRRYSVHFSALHPRGGARSNPFSSEERPRNAEHHNLYIDLPKLRAPPRRRRPLPRRKSRSHSAPDPNTRGDLTDRLRLLRRRQKQGLRTFNSIIPTTPTTPPSPEPACRAAGRESRATPASGPAPGCPPRRSPRRKRGGGRWEVGRHPHRTATAACTSPTGRRGRLGSRPAGARGQGREETGVSVSE